MKEEIICNDSDENINNDNIPKVTNHWNVFRIYILNDNWSESDVDWIQNRTGTKDDPHIIENVTVKAIGFNFCIKIENSDDYCIIRNCTAYNAAPGAYYGGIWLDNSKNCHIINNNCSDNADIGIYLMNSNNNTVIGNIAQRNEFGIYISNSHNNTITDNKLTNNNGDGITVVDSSSNNIISKNLATNIGNTDQDYGIRLVQCSNNSISENTVSKNNNMGIYLNNNCNNNTVIGNYVINGGMSGIWLSSSQYNNISMNYVKNNPQDSLHLENCYNNNIYYNCFMDTSVIVGDTTGSNYWDNGNIGNYWNDYISKGGVDDNDDGIGDINYTINSLVNDTLPIFEIPYHNGSKIHIDETGTSALNWSQIALIKWWCSGSGIYSSPYIIKNLIINGNNESYCILIGNSSAYTQIQNCTVYNASTGGSDPGIKLYNVNNSQLVDNNCSFNHWGIHLENCNSNNITGNFINFNYIGICLNNSNNNRIIGNNLLNNDIWKVDNGVGNIFEDNIIPTSVLSGGNGGNGGDSKESEDFDYFIIIIIILIAIAVIAVSGIILKKRKVFLKKRELEPVLDKKADIKPIEITVTPPKMLKGSKKIFLSYSTLDSEYFEIPKIAKILRSLPKIKNVFFWEKDSGTNIVDFMEENLTRCDIFVLFCTKNAAKSDSVKGEWQSAYQKCIKGLMKMVPVYENEDLVPALLAKYLTVEYSKEDFNGFINQLYKAIFR